MPEKKMSKELYENIYEQAFSFGENWAEYLKKLDAEKIQRAQKSLEEFLGKGTIKGKTFLDIGCGSGLFSLAAIKLGAREVTSIDPDKNSTECAKYLREKFKIPSKKWKILKGSILDKKFIKKLPKADITYSWGVLHHTGDMWRALDNAISLVRKKGTLYIAIYNKYTGPLSSKSWLKIKKLYVRSPKLVKKAMELLYAGEQLISLAIRLKNPIAYVRNYKTDRGMSFMRDVTDWLGGYPYEYATPAEIEEHCKRRGLKLVKIKHRKGTGCNEFVFKRTC
ncbi:class I SAM-dependent methyltransferase [Candidatus Woesearchaeota archaeon]|nr:MAG: class I SAM-dependent methyltransferase [Candidatus Woesearchaeota archaeon]